MFDSQSALAHTLQKVKKTASRVQDTIPYETVHGVYNRMDDDIHWWTNGFWAGLLWLAWHRTKDGDLARWAVGIEEKLDAALSEYDKLDHDVGFLWHLSAVADYQATGSRQSARRGFTAAGVLASRFNPAGSFIRAWNAPERTGWAIIDCMMNLPLLYWAAGYAKDPRFFNIAQAHAQTAMTHFIREDGSVKHICSFDPVTGAYIENFGGQGYGVDSSWSRGTAWALYGFTLSAAYTGRRDFLATGQRVANFFLSHLPEDQVPLADFRAPARTNIHKDSSAAACAASGLVLLAQMVSPDEAGCYRSAAERIVRSLYENYTDWDHDEALIQKGCTAYFNDGHPDQLETSLVYGDYFFLEALIRLCGGSGLFEPAGR